MSTYPAVHACAQALLAGAVLQTAGVSAGRGLVVDWRTIKSGETLQSDGDAFDTAQLFVAIVGVEAALAIVDDDAAPAPPPKAVPEITVFRPNEHGQRVRTFTTPGGFKVTVQSAMYGEDDETAAAALASTLAKFAEGLS